MILSEKRSEFSGRFLLDAIGFVGPDHHDYAVETFGDRAKAAVELSIFFSISANIRSCLPAV